jgi:hypothetical protein
MRPQFVEERDALFISHALETFAKFAALIDGAKEAPYAPEKCGVPPAMWDEPVRPDGWVLWRMLPSTVTEQQVRELEQLVNAEFPPLFRAFLTARFIMELGTPWVRLPALPSDAPLRDVRRMIRACAPLHEAGYVAFANDTNDTGPVCFDVVQRLPDGDCPVVLFDHDVLGHHHADLGRRAAIAPLARSYFASFRHVVRRCLVEYAQAIEQKTFDWKTFYR